MILFDGFYFATLVTAETLRCRRFVCFTNSQWRC